MRAYRGVQKSNQLDKYHVAYVSRLKQMCVGEDPATVEQHLQQHADGDYANFVEFFGTDTARSIIVRYCKQLRCVHKV
jgi:hypothetical protein